MNARWNQSLCRVALSLVIVCVLVFSTNHPVQAGIGTFKFSGVIDSVPTPGPLNPLAAPIVKNTPFSGSYSFSSTAPDLDPTQVFGEYTMSNLSFDLMGQHYTSAPGGKIFILNDTTVYTYNVVTPLSMNNGSMQGRVDIALFPNNFSTGGFPRDANGFYLNGDSNVLTPPSLSGLDRNLFRITVWEGQLFSQKDLYDGHLTSLTLAPVPLPGALILFGSSLLGLAGLGLRRRASRTQ